MPLSDKEKAQLDLLRIEAAHKRAVIKVHMPISGTYYTLRDAHTNAPIGRYDSLIELEDTLINWLDDPDDPIDDRDAERATR